MSSAIERWHQEILAWYETNAGVVFDHRPRLVGLERGVTDPQSGIWKPRGTDYAASVLGVRNGPYPDRPPVFVEGSWTYLYHKEGPPQEDVAARKTNVGLLSCMSDGIPVGVMVPARERGIGAYRVLGLGFVERYWNGYFVISGPATLGSQDVGADLQQLERLELVDIGAEDSETYDGTDTRQRVLASVVRRQGQPRFRSRLIAAYDGRCAMTGYDAVDALEAAHIRPFTGPGSNATANGLLLRADMHDLFDLGLVAVNTSAVTLVLSGKLAGTMYEDLHGRRLRVPRLAELRPSLEALDEHRALAGL